MGGTVPPAGVFQLKERGAPLVLWVCRAPGGLQGSRDFRDFRVRRGTEEMKVRWELVEGKEMLEPLAILGLQVQRESRVTQAPLEVLVILVWMGVTEPEETRVLLGFQENRDKMENGVLEVQRDSQEIKRPTSSSYLELLAMLGPVDCKVCRAKMDSQDQLDLLVQKDQMETMVFLVHLAQGVHLVKKADYCRDHEETRESRGSRGLQDPLSTSNLQRTSTSKGRRDLQGEKESAAFQESQVKMRPLESKERKGLSDFPDSEGILVDPVLLERKALGGWKEAWVSLG